MRGRKSKQVISKMIAWMLTLVVLGTSIPIDGMRVYAEEKKDEVVSDEVLEGVAQEYTESEEIIRAENQIEESETVETNEVNLEPDANQQESQDAIFRESDSITLDDAVESNELEEATVMMDEVQVVLERALQATDGFTIEEGVITAYTGTSTEIVIPAEATGLQHSVFINNKNVQSVDFSQNTSITSIPMSTFAGCTELQTIIFSDSITEIRENAFQGCTKLENLTLPNKLENIKDDAFYGCKKITEITIPASVVNMGDVYSAFRNCSNLTTIIFADGMNKIPNKACAGLSELASVAIPKTVNELGMSSFLDCTSLKKISLPNNLVTIDENCFQGCIELENPILPNKLENIEDDAFYGCTKITEITIPASIKNMGNVYSAFRNCSNLTTVVFAEGLTKVPNKACEGGSGITSVTIPKTVGTLGLCAFLDCTNLTMIELPDNISTIDKSSFPKDTGLKFKVTKGSKTENALIEAGFVKENIVYVQPIQYVLNGGNYSPEGSYPKTFDRTTGNLSVSNPAERTGYTFGGWYFDSRFTNLAVKDGILDTSKLNDSVTLYAKWAPISYTISYDLNKPSSASDKVTSDIASVSVKYDTTVKAATNKNTITKYTFVGWNTKADGKGTAYKAGVNLKNLSSEAGSTVTLYATWTPTTYTVKYDANATSVGGKASGSVKASKFTFDNTENITNGNLYRIPGYTFTGWNTRADGRGLSFGDGENTNGVAAIGKALETTYAKDTNATVTLYAQWTRNKHTLTLHKNIPDSDDAPISISDVDVTISIPTDDITRPGYKLKNWNTQADGKGKSYALNAKGITEDLTLYAQWTGPISYTVTYVLDGGTNSSKNIKKYTIATAEVSRTLQAPTKKGYHFVKWVDITEGEAPEAAAEVSALPVDAPKNIKLQAVWEENRYKVRFHNSNEEYSSKVEFDKEYTYAEILDLFAARNAFMEAPSLTEKAKTENKNIIAWTTKPDGKGTSYVVGKNYSKLAADAYEETTGKGVIDLYAKWGTASYQIKYVSEGEMKNTSNPATYSYNISKKVSIKAPTRAGYIFTGWTSGNENYDAANKVIKAGATGDITLNATWKPISYTVKLNINSKDARVKNAVKQNAALQYTGIKYATVEEGDNIFDANAIYNSADAELTAAYEFVGWNTKANGTGTMLPMEGDKVSLEKLSTKNNATVTIYAIWKPKSYTITYVNVDPENSEEELSNVTNKNVISYTYNPSKAVSLSNPTKYGFVFKGWYTDKNFETQYKSIPKNTTGNITVYGKWEVKK